MKRKIFLKLGVAFATLVFLNSCVKKGAGFILQLHPGQYCHQRLPFLIRF